MSTILCFIKMLERKYNVVEMLKKNATRCRHCNHRARMTVPMWAACLCIPVFEKVEHHNTLSNAGWPVDHSVNPVRLSSTQPQAGCGRPHCRLTHRYTTQTYMPPVVHIIVFDRAHSHTSHSEAAFTCQYAAKRYCDIREPPSFVSTYTWSNIAEMCVCASLRVHINHTVS